MQRVQKHQESHRHIAAVWGLVTANSLYCPICFLRILCVFCFVYFSCPISFAQNIPATTSASTAELSGSALLEKAALHAQKLKSIKSNILMNVMIDGHEYIARGEYLEKMFAHNPGEMALSKFRLELKFPLSANSSDNVSNHMIVVCKDNSRVWHYTSIENRKVQNWIDIRRVLDAAKASNRPHQLVALGGMPGLGGLGGMLRSLEIQYEFSEPPTESSMKGKDPLPVWVLRGKLREESVDALLIQRDWREDKNKKLPALFPLNVEIYLGRDDLFPYRIHFYTAPHFASKKRELMTELVYCDVLLNSEISDYHFNTFDEQGARASDGSDITEQYLRSLGL